MAPTFGSGKICYLEIPALDIAVSSAFFRDAFGWTSAVTTAGASRSMTASVR